MSFSLMHFMCVFVLSKIVKVNIKGGGNEGPEKAEEKGVGEQREGGGGGSHFDN